MNSVYKLNFPNGKSYIGQTSKSVRERFVEHSWDRTNSNSQLHRPITFAMKKYKGLVTYTILEGNLNSDEADYLEKYYIKFYDSLVNNNGYNLSPGGSTGSIMSESGKKRRAEKMQKLYDDPEYVEKITKHLKTDEHREKMETGFKEFLKNNPNHYKELGKRNVIRNKERGSRLKRAKSKGGKPFYCVETGEVFYMLQDAADRFDVDKRSIHKVLKYPDRNKTILRKYSFKYLEEKGE